MKNQKILFGTPMFQLDKKLEKIKQTQIDGKPKEFWLNQLKKFLDSFDVSYKQNIQIDNIPIDFFIKKENLAINICMQKDFTIEKVGTKELKTRFDICNSNGIRLIQIFDDELIYMNKKVFESIQHFIKKSPKGTYGRNTIIRELDWKETKLYFDRFHLLNSGQPGNYRIGAFDKNTNEFVGGCIFGSPSNERGSVSEVELKRLITNKKNNPGVVGKMLKYAKNNRGFDEIFAFVDVRWFDGDCKKQNGFIIKDFTQPALWYSNLNQRFHRRIITKKLLVEKFKTPEKSKKEMMADIGFYQIFDCGKIKLQYLV